MNRISIKYKERTWENIPIGEVRTIRSVLEEFAPLMLFPQTNIKVYINGNLSRMGRAIVDGSALEIKDEEVNDDLSEDKQNTRQISKEEKKNKANSSESEQAKTDNGNRELSEISNEVGV